MFVILSEAKHLLISVIAEKNLIEERIAVMVHLLVTFVVLYLILRLVTRPFRHRYRHGYGYGCRHRRGFGGGLLSILALVALDHLMDRRF
jgi:hypothetical protein